MARVVHFEIYADEPERAAGFYRAVFGWDISKWGEYDYWYVKTGEESEHGINGGIMKRNKTLQGSDVAAFVCTVKVGNLDDFIKAVENAHGTIAIPKAYLPGVGYLVYCRDTEGNLFGLMQDEKR